MTLNLQKMKSKEQKENDLFWGKGNIEYKHFNNNVKSITVKVINESSNPLPKYTKNGDACLDLQASFDKGWDDTRSCGAAFDDEAKCLRIFSGGRALIDTGLYTAFPEGYMLKILERSGLGSKGIKVNGGVVDAGYRGSIKISLINLSDEDIEIHQGDRIAQACIIEVPKIEWKEVESLEETDRGATGFGESGI